MIELTEGLPDGIVGLEAVGEVSSEDYATVANPAVEHALEGTARSGSCTSSMTGSPATAQAGCGTTRSSGSRIPAPGSASPS